MITISLKITLGINMNCTDIVKNIMQRGFTQTEIATFCDCGQSSIGMIATGARGKRPSYQIASRLIKMKSMIESGELTKDNS